ncbi:GNAT family N-acetyltransferase [Streptomyces netropsis]|uniref:GNAT superfamily N-acetyltransferase n=1 Tax=Streptomyces netropsis TaxID=55404 RepID=A0A7W7PCI2_STRNE|nr:GNAT family N-acetyltransferase [Streptomyces netropsis]MBB4884627.1 GNAT superfamily N-acetyltransferase [Streptomyces netropsis]GGR02356.1 N-acetyltransferase [Streptomyces netropsis]
MVRVREMTEADIEAVSGIRVTGWQTAYAGVVPQPYLDAMTVEDDARRRRTWFTPSRGQALDLVAVDDRAVAVGWASLGPYREEAGAAGESYGELYALYVRPDRIGTGVGRLLLQEVHRHAAALRFDSLLLWVLTDNPRARRFYETAGYTADGAVQSDLYDEVELTEVRYRRAL